MDNDNIQRVSPAQQPEQSAAPTPELRFSMSAGIGKLIEALAKASLSFEPIKKESENPFFKSYYADLAAVIEATRKHLGANGIAVIQPPVRTVDGKVEIITLMAHSSGEWIKSILEMTPTKMDAQGVGSAITYGRRYSYSAILNVASEEDDDGNAAVSGEFKKKKKEETPDEFDQRTEQQQCIQGFQIKAIEDACKRSGKTEEETKAYLGLIGHKKVGDLFKSEFNDFLKWANAVKKTDLPTMKPASKIAYPKEDQRAKANRRLWATAAELSIPEKDVKTFAYEKFGVDSMTNLTEAQLDETSDWIKEVARAVSES